MINKNIKKIRKKLDILDNAFLKLIKKRTLLVNQVLKNKKYKKDVIDRKRISLILKNIRTKSKKSNIRYIIRYCSIGHLYLYFIYNLEMLKYQHYLFGGIWIWQSEGNLLN